MSIPKKRQITLEYLGLAHGEIGIINSRNLQFENNTPKLMHVPMLELSKFHRKSFISKINLKAV